jgi:hypothetical protein
MLWPFSPPVHDNAPQAESISMLRCIVLDDALEAESFVTSLATIAIEDLLAQGLRVRLKLGVKDPFHVL